MKQKEYQQRENPSWNSDQLKVARRLYFHFGDDYQRISQELREMHILTSGLAYWQQTPSHCKYMLEKYGNYDIIDTQPFSSQNSLETYRLVKHYSKLDGRRIFNEVSKHFNDKPTWIIKEDFQSTISFICEILFFWYTPIKQSDLYFKRFRRFQVVTWLMILYFAQNNLDIFHIRNEFVDKIHSAALKLDSWIELFIQNGFHMSNRDYNIMKLDQNIPLLNQQEVEEVAETLLTLEYTLNRVCFSLHPYYLCSWSRTGYNKKPIMQDGRKIKMLDYFQDCDEDVQQNLDHSFTDPIELDQQMPFDDKYIRLSRFQRKLLINSEESLILLPYLSRLDQKNYIPDHMNITSHNKNLKT